MVNKRERKIEKLLGVPSGRPRKLRVPPVEPGMHKGKRGQEGADVCLQANRICTVPMLISSRSLLPTAKAWSGSSCEFLQQVGRWQGRRSGEGSLLALHNILRSADCMVFPGRLGVTGCGAVCCVLHSNASLARDTGSTTPVYPTTSVY